jgi:hypothetical protein
MLFIYFYLIFTLNYFIFYNKIIIIINRNQNYIDKLKLQGVVQDNSLSEQGINIEIDPEKGKFKINYKDDNNNK